MVSFAISVADKHFLKGLDEQLAIRDQGITWIIWEGAIILSSDNVYDHFGIKLDMKVFDVQILG